MDSSSPFPPLHILEPSEAHTHTIIALHGRGSNGAEFSLDLFEGKTSGGMNLRDSLPNCKWIFPSSQQRWSTVFQVKMDEWFDIYSLKDPSQREYLQIEGLRDSINHLTDIIKAEARAVGHDHILLLGISQGYATGILTLLACQQKLGAFVGISGWMPFRDQIERIAAQEIGSHDQSPSGNVSQKPLPQVQAQLKHFFQDTFGIVKWKPTAEPAITFSTPMLLSHNNDDDVVDVGLGWQAFHALESLGVGQVMKTYENGGHWVNEPEGLDEIAAFLNSVGVNMGT